MLQTCSTSDHAYSLSHFSFRRALLVWSDCEVTLAIVDAEATGPSHVNAAANLHIVQVLRHLTTLGKLWVHILEVHLCGTIILCVR